MNLPQNKFDQYHIHVYFNEDTSEIAAQLRENIATQLEMEVGNFNQKLVGPHLQWNFYVPFSKAQFDKIIPWIAQHRNGLSVLLHKDTGDDWVDHTEDLFWFGEVGEIDISMFIPQTTQNNT